LDRVVVDQKVIAVRLLIALPVKKVDQVVNGTGFGVAVGKIRRIPVAIHQLVVIIYTVGVLGVLVADKGAELLVCLVEAIDVPAVKGPERCRGCVAVILHAQGQAGGLVYWSKVDAQHESRVQETGVES